MAARGGGAHDQAAADRIRGRDSMAWPRAEVVFLPNRVRIGSDEVTFADLVKQAYLGARARCRPPATTRTPKIHYDRATAAGRPFFYFAYGAAVQRGDRSTR